MTLSAILSQLFGRSWYIMTGLCNSDTNQLALLVLFAEARAQAKALDDEFTRTGKVRGPLHGVPVSFKDTCE